MAAVPPICDNRRMARNRLARTTTYEHTISGLLKRRAELFGEAERIRDRLAEINNDVAALDRILVSLGCKANLDLLMPKQKRPPIINYGAAVKLILDALKEAEPLSSREIARKTLENCGQDAADRKALSDATERVSRTLRRLRDRGLLIGIPDEDGHLFWTIKQKGQS